MAEEQRMNDDPEFFEAALSGLTPRPSQINRDRLMYEACRSAVANTLATNRAKLRFWKIMTGVSTLAAISFAALRYSSVFAPVVVVTDTIPPSGFQQTSVPNGRVERQVRPDFRSDEKILGLGSTYIHQRNLALAAGLENDRVWQTVETPEMAESEPPMTYRQRLQSIVHSDFGG